jgi:hypothetical protein
MALNIGETVSEHPKATAIFVVVAVVVLWLLFHGGGSQGASPSAQLSDAQTQAATDAYVAQQQTAQASANGQLALQAQSDQLGAQLAATKINADTTNNANAIAGNVAMYQLGVQEEIARLQSANTDTANTLAAGVANNAANQVTQQRQIDASTNIATTTLVTNALVQQSHDQLQAQVEQGNNNLQALKITTDASTAALNAQANAYVASQQLQTSAYVAVNKPRSLFQQLFG